MSRAKIPTDIWFLTSRNLVDKMIEVITLWPMSLMLLAVNEQGYQSYELVLFCEVLYFIHFTQTLPPPSQVHDAFHFLASEHSDEVSFIWASENTGHRHLYHIRCYLKKPNRSKRYSTGDLISS